MNRFFISHGATQIRQVEIAFDSRSAVEKIFIIFLINVHCLDARDGNENVFEMCQLLTTYFRRKQTLNIKTNVKHLHNFHSQWHPQSWCEWLEDWTEISLIKFVPDVMKLNGNRSDDAERPNLKTVSGR